VAKDAPYAAPIVSMANGTVSHLLHKIVSLGATALQPLEEPESHSKVPRGVRGRGGAIRPWSGEISGM
jgi:hypothetical protein